MSLDQESRIRVPNTIDQDRRLVRLAETGPVGVLGHCLTITLEIDGPIRVDVISAALREVCARHPGLRSVFEFGQTSHTVLPATWAITLDRRLMVGTDPRRRRADAVAYAETEARRPFPPTGGPLFRASLLSVSEASHFLVLSFDQLIIDAWSAAMVVEELIGIADALARGSTPPPGEPDGYVALRRHEAASPPPDPRRRHALAGSRGRIPLRVRPSPDTATVPHESVSLPYDVLEAISRHSSAAGVTLFAAMLAAFAAAVGIPVDSGGQLISSTYARRESELAETVVGWLSNRVLIRLPPTGSSIRDYARALRIDLISALQNQAARAEDLEPADSGLGVAVSVLYLPAQMSGGAATGALTIGDAAVHRQAGTVCPGGQDIDLFIAETPRLLNGDQPGLVLGGTGSPAAVDGASLKDLLDSWADAVRALADTADWAGVQMNSLPQNGRVLDVPDHGPSDSRLMGG